MRLSNHFHLEEFLRSETAARMGREIEIEDSRIVEHLTYLCVHVLEPLREILDRPIVITSGYRPQWLNRSIGGSPNSEHMDGRAADIVVPGFTPFFVCKTAEIKQIPFNQCIHEFPPRGWCHISVPKPGEPPRRECLTATKVAGKTVYRPGIVHA